MQNKWRRERNISLGRVRSSSGPGTGGLKDTERRWEERAAVLPFTPGVDPEHVLRALQRVTAGGSETHPTRAG